MCSGMAAHGGPWHRLGVEGVHDGDNSDDAAGGAALLQQPTLLNGHHSRAEQSEVGEPEVRLLSDHNALPPARPRISSSGHIALTWSLVLQDEFEFERDSTRAALLAGGTHAWDHI